MDAVLANVDLSAVIKRIADGEYASRIADELGTSKQLLSYHLRKHPGWPDTLEAAHESRMDQTEISLDSAIAARDFDLARAREGQLKRREWRASVECPHRWGQKQEVHHTFSISDVLKEVSERRQRERDAALDVVDAEVVHPQQTLPNHPITD